MKKFLLSLGCMVLSAVLITGCSGSREDPSGQEDGMGATGTLTYSNMMDEPTRDEIGARLEAAGVDAEYAAAFFAMVNDYNGLVGTLSEFAEGYTEVNANTMDYAEDTYSKWMDARPYADANCRIAAFMLFRGSLSIRKPQDMDSFLVIDEDALDNYTLCGLSKEERGGFAALFNPVSVEPTIDSDVVLKAVQTEWQNRGIEFRDGPVSLVSVLMHSELDNIGYMGHVGVMVEDKDGVLFLEKLAPTSPYQATEFKSREELKTYLLNCFSTFYTEGVSAKPVVLINDYPL